MRKNISKNISQNLSGKYRQNLSITLNNLQQIHLKLLQKKVIHKTSEATDDFIDDKIANKTTKI